VLQVDRLTFDSEAVNVSAEVAASKILRHIPELSGHSVITHVTAWIHCITIVKVQPADFVKCSIGGHETCDGSSFRSCLRIHCDGSAVRT
jgi:hypothetical protein